MTKRETTVNKTNSKKQNKTAKTKTPKKTSNKTSTVQLSCEERFKLIEEAAYNRAQNRNFEGDGALEDWLTAEKEIDAQFSVET